MKNYKFKIRGQEYEVEIKSFEENLASIEVNGTPYQVEVASEVKAKPMSAPKSAARPMASAPKAATKPAGGASTVKAPLPGNIFKIEVKVGDTVDKGQKLLIMEAMKMENDVLAEKPGTVAAIKVSEGDAVLQGDVLVELS